MKHLLKRLAFILIGYALASIASGIVVWFVYLGHSIFARPSIAAMFSESFVICGAVTLFIAAYAALPALLVVVIGEIRQIQVWLYYAVAGCLIGGALPVVVGMTELIPTGILFGPIAGLIYWWIAGRRASLRLTSVA